MICWLVETLLWTGVLMALVLLIRRPAAKVFGAQLAYALWLLPLLRFVLPPLTQTAPAATAPAAPGLMVVPVLAQAPPAAAVAASPSAGWLDRLPQLAEAVAPVLITLWLTGAAAFLLWRAGQYLVLRRRLLAESREVGVVADVRVVETPWVAAPLALGVVDRVIAVPPDFAHLPAAARELALEHEREHHRGGDLIANLLAQPILALHWFDPLAWIAWRTMRRDQEAACDQRVIAGRSAADRAAYAELLVSFARGATREDRAPMACGVLGGPAIVDRLRGLTARQPETPRRTVGRLLLCASGLALPATATIEYAGARPVARSGERAALAAPAAGSAFAASPAGLAAAAAPAALAEHGAEPLTVVGSAPVAALASASPLTPIAPHAPLRLELGRQSGEAIRTEALAAAAREREEASREAAAERAEALREAAQARDEALREAAQVRAEAMREAASARAEAMREAAAAIAEARATTSFAHSEALHEIRATRASLARDRSIPEAARRQVLTELDGEIARLEQQRRASHH